MLKNSFCRKMLYVVMMMTKFIRNQMQLYIR